MTKLKWLSTNSNHWIINVIHKIFGYSDFSCINNCRWKKTKCTKAISIVFPVNISGIWHFFCFRFITLSWEVRIMLIDNCFWVQNYLRPFKIDCVFCINTLVQFSRLEWKKCTLIFLQNLAISNPIFYIVTMFFSRPPVCAVFLPLRIGFHKSFDAKHTINFKWPYEGNALPRFLLYARDTVF